MATGVHMPQNDVLGHHDVITHHGVHEAEFTKPPVSRTTVPRLTRDPLEGVATWARQISSITHINPLSENEYRDKKERENYERFTNNTYLNRVVQYLGEKNQITCERVAKTIHRFVEYFAQEVGRQDPRFKLRDELIPCGSSYEGVKISEPNEFDYLYELSEDSISQRSLDIIHVKPETFKPRKQEAVQPKTYYKLRFREGMVPKLWQCKPDQSGHSSCPGGNQCSCLDLNARDIQQIFRDVVQQVANSISKEWNTAHVRMCGPAVTIYVKLDYEECQSHLDPEQVKKLSHRLPDERYFVIKIDMSLVIPLTAGPRQKWPLEGLGDAHLDPTAAPGRIERCHLVTSGDFWRATFSHWESRHIKDFTGKHREGKVVFQALKSMRDELSLTDQHESGILSSYPLKVMFMKETVSRMPEDWRYEAMSQRTVGILQRLEDEGNAGLLTSFYVENDPVLMESDRSYLESRRLRQYLRKLTAHFNVHGLVHTITLGAVALCMFAMMVASVIYLDKYYERDFSYCEAPDPKRGCSRALGTYIFVLLPATFITLVSNTVGFLWIVVPQCLGFPRAIIYAIYRGIKFIHGGFLILDFVMVSLAIAMTIGYYELFSHTLNPTMVLVITIMFITITVVVLVMYISHVTYFLVFTKCSISRYPWEWVFMDGVYEPLLRSCACCCKGKGSGGEASTADEPSDSGLPSGLQDRTQRESASFDNPVYTM